MRSVFLILLLGIVTVADAQWSLDDMYISDESVLKLKEKLIQDGSEKGSVFTSLTSIAYAVGGGGIVISPLQYKIARLNTDSNSIQLEKIIELVDTSQLKFYRYFEVDSNSFQMFSYDVDHLDVKMLGKDLISNELAKYLVSLLKRDVPFFTIECIAGLWFIDEDKLKVVNTFGATEIIEANKLLAAFYSPSNFNMENNYQMTHSFSELRYITIRKNYEKKRKKKFCRWVRNVIF